MLKMAKMTPKQHYRKFSKFGLAGLLLGAVSFAAQKMEQVGRDTITKKDTGDLVTLRDKASQAAVQEYFKVNNVPAVVNGEEGVGRVENPKYLVLLDALEGTQNSVNDLDYGINIAVAPYKASLRVKDLEAAVVCNLKTGAIFAGEKNKGAFKMQDGEKKKIVRKQTDVYEIPMATAYTTDVLQKLRQKELIDIFYEILGNQPRSIDATGTRLVALLEGNIKAYGDWRQATKCWDVLPSALILQEEGFRLTDVMGFELSEGIFYDERIQRDNGLNRTLGQDFIAASSEDHDKLVFGKGESVWRRITYGVTKPLDEVHFSSFHSGYPDLIPTKEKEFYRFGRMMAQVLQHNIDERVKIYGGTNKNNVCEIVQKVRETFVDVMPNSSFPEEGPLHLLKFDEIMSWMTDYDLSLNRDFESIPGYKTDMGVWIA